MNRNLGIFQQIFGSGKYDEPVGVTPFMDDGGYQGAPNIPLPEPGRLAPNMRFRDPIDTPNTHSDYPPPPRSPWGGTAQGAGYRAIAPDYSGRINIQPGADNGQDIWDRPDPGQVFRDIEGPIHNATRLPSRGNQSQPSAPAPSPQDRVGRSAPAAPSTTPAPQAGVQNTPSKNPTPRKRVRRGGRGLGTENRNPNTRGIPQAPVPRMPRWQAGPDPAEASRQEPRLTPEQLRQYDLNAAGDLQIRTPDRTFDDGRPLQVEERTARLGFEPSPGTQNFSQDGVGLVAAPPAEDEVVVTGRRNRRPDTRNPARRRRP